MLAVIAEAASDTVASEVARHLMVNLGDPTRPLPIPLASEGPDDPLVRRALDLINDRLDESRNCAALARDLGVSLRQLQRRVQTAQGRSLGREWQEAQFARAHQLVQQTDLSLTEIAIAVGYGSLEAFSRAYRKRFGISPSRDREQTTRTSVFRPPVLGVR
jgi:AraC family carnitine catabolism transcriptional activator